MSTRQSAGRVRSTYEFIKAHRDQYSVHTMCRVLELAPSGYYEWLKQPISSRAQEDARLLRLIRAVFSASQGIYGALASSWICARRERRAASIALRASCA
jgi:putative transposase